MTHSHPSESSQQVDKQYSLKRKSKEEREAELAGRLASPALKALLEDHARWVAAGAGCLCFAHLERACWAATEAGCLPSAWLLRALLIAPAKHAWG